MTNEELKIHLLLLKENARGIADTDTIMQNIKKESFVWIIDEVIKTLEQKPCEDCTSKESVIEWLKNKDIIKTKNQEENARRELAELPSATPQSCGDTINRKQAIEDLTLLINNFKNVQGDLGSAVNAARELIKELPPATSQEPEGEWVEYEVDIASHPLHCSICGFSDHHINNRYIREFRRCPNCGAEMKDNTIKHLRFI